MKPSLSGAVLQHALTAVAALSREPRAELIGERPILFFEPPDDVLQLIVLLPDLVLHLREASLHPPRLGNSATNFRGFVIHALRYSNLAAAPDSILLPQQKSTDERQRPHHRSLGGR